VMIADAVGWELAAEDIARKHLTIIIILRLSLTYSLD
jgi:hypothetical protein